MVEDVSFYAVGDVAPYREDPDTMFTYTRSTLNQADILFFQNERHYTRRGTYSSHTRFTEVVPPEHANVLKEIKFDVASFASNHSMDLGADALFDTCDTLKQMGFQVIGAGKNIAEARKPAIVERKGIRVGFLAYTSVIRDGMAAGLDKPGVAPLRAWNVYRPLAEWEPGSPAKVHTFPNREDLANLVTDIKKLRPLVDVLVVSMHWGLLYRPTVIADYQIDGAHAIIDAGADLILGHHPHILKGIEVYKGKVIFYSIGHFAFDISGQVRQQMEKDWPERTEYGKFLNMKIEPEWFHSQFAYAQDNRKSMIVKCIIADGSIARVSFMPVLINKQAQPVLINREDENFNEIMNFVTNISMEAGLKVKLHAEGDEVVVGTQGMDA